MQIPAYYGYTDVYNSASSPSTMHTGNTRLKDFFAKYLLEKAISVYEFTIPASWAKNYFLYSLFAWGPVAVLKTEEFGVIPQACGLSGYNVFYQPKRAIVANPLLPQYRDLVIDRDCVVLHIQPDYSPVLDIVSYYADLLACCAEAIGTNLFNSKLAYVFSCKSKAGAESFKKMFDKVASGEPAVFVDQQLLGDGKSWECFASNLKENYLVSDILLNMSAIEKQFETDVGIPNSNTDKRERLTDDEVNANNVSTYSKAALWLENLQDGFEKVRDMFDIDLSADWRVFNNA